MFINIDPSSGLPIYIQIAQQIKTAVAMGRLQPEEPLPSVRQLAVEHSNDLETADRSLSDIENLLEHSLLTKLDPVRLAEVEKDIASQLRPFKSQMEPDAYKQTSRVMILKRLRDEEGIPRLSLFYL